MKIIEITTNDSIDQYCFLCGSKNIGEKGVEKVCDHLVYVGTNDGGPEFDKLKLHNDSNEEKSPSEIIEKLDDNYLGFYLSAGAPSHLEVYIVYKIKY